MTEVNSLVRIIADIVSADFESYSMVLKEVGDWAIDEKIAFDQSDIVNALRLAIDTGYVQAFKYSASQNKFEAAQWNDKLSNDLYFYATVKGRDILD